MLKQQSSCCLCQHAFQPHSQPRMIPHCQHSACSPCIKQYILKQLPTLTCLFCGQKQHLTQYDLEYFPKNVMLNKQLKEKSFVFLWSKKEEGDTEQSQESHVQRHFCTAHQKEQEIVCLTDRTRICPHCALFGPHRQHELKTVKEVHQLIQHKKDQLQSIRSRKAALDSKMSSPEFKTDLVKQITQHKNQLLASIKQKYQQLHQNIKLAQKNAYQDVAKRFKTINQKITDLMREEHEPQKMYREWGNKIKVIEKGEKCIKLEDKAYFYLSKPVNISEEGQKVLEELEKKINCKKDRIEGLISNIRIVQNQTVPNSIFNYLNVIIQDHNTVNISHTTPQHKSPMRVKSENTKTSLDLKSQHTVKQPESPIIPPRRTCVSTEKTRQKDMSVLKRRSVKADEPALNLEDVVTEFCEKNLETLDLTGQALYDFEVIQILSFVKSVKKIKGLKLVRNRLTSQGLVRLLDLIPQVTNLNLSFNNLTDDAISQVLSNYKKVPQLRIINLSNNKINERRSKNILDHLKRQGLIITL